MSFFTPIILRLRSSEAEVTDVKILIIGENEYRSVHMTALLVGEGFEVDYTSGSGYDNSFLMQYDVLIINHYTIDINNLAVSVAGGVGVFILPSREFDTLLAFAGVVPGSGEGNGVTSRFTVHPVTEGVRAMSVRGTEIGPVSSDAYPLVLGNDDDFGIEDPVLAVANNLGSGRIILLNADPYFDSAIAQEDNALFFKNAIYWLAHMDVPPFTRGIPSLVSIEDKADLLNESVNDLSLAIDEISHDIGNVKNIDSIVEDVDVLSNQLQGLSTQLGELFGNVSTLPGDVSLLLENMSILQERIEDVIKEEADIQELSYRITDLSAQIDALQYKIDNNVPASTMSLFEYLSPVALVVALAGVALSFKKKA